MNIDNDKFEPCEISFEGIQINPVSNMEFEPQPIMNQGGTISHEDCVDCQVYLYTEQDFLQVAKMWRDRYGF